MFEVFTNKGTGLKQAINMEFVHIIEPAPDGGTRLWFRLGSPCTVTESLEEVVERANHPLVVLETIPGTIFSQEG